MKSLKSRLLDNYVYGFITGLGVGGLIGLIYLRAVLEIRLGICPADSDYGWVTFITGTDTLSGTWCAGKAGSTTFLMILALLAIFLGVILGVATIKERKL